jgi:hypothetical protein
MRQGLERRPRRPRCRSSTARRRTAPRSPMGRCPGQRRSGIPRGFWRPPRAAGTRGDARLARTIEKAEQPVKPVLAVQAAALVAHLHQPGPDVLRRRIHGDGPPRQIGGIGEQRIAGHWGLRGLHAAAQRQGRRLRVLQGVPPGRDRAALDSGTGAGGDGGVARAVRPVAVVVSLAAQACTTAEGSGAPPSRGGRVAAGDVVSSVFGSWLRHVKPLGSALICRLAWEPSPPRERSGRWASSRSRRTAVSASVILRGRERQSWGPRHPWMSAYKGSSREPEEEPRAGGRRPGGLRTLCPVCARPAGSEAQEPTVSGARPVGRPSGTRRAATYLCSRRSGLRQPVVTPAGRCPRA